MTTDNKAPEVIEKILKRVSGKGGSQRVICEKDCLVFMLRDCRGKMHAYWKQRGSENITSDNGIDIETIIEEYCERYNKLSLYIEAEPIENLYSRTGRLSPLKRNIDHMYETLVEARKFDDSSNNDNIAYFKNQVSDLKRDFNLLEMKLKTHIEYSFSIRQDKLNKMQSLAFFIIMIASIFGMDFSSEGLLGYINQTSKYQIVTNAFLLASGLGYLAYLWLRKSPKLINLGEEACQD
jgi:hypothetical protein